MAKEYANPLLQRVAYFFKKNEFLLLLIVLLSFLLVPSFFLNPTVKDPIIYSLLLLVLIVGIFELSDSKKIFYAGIVIGILAIGSININFSNKSETLFIIRMATLIAFFGLLMFHVFIRLMRTKHVTTNLIYAAVTGYILIGLIGGMGFRIIHHYYEHSFVFTSGLDAKIDDLTYFSFVTLSSLGYGDITPVSPPGQSLAIFISICGQMYTVVVIGIIIGKYILRRN